MTSRDVANVRLARPSALDRLGGALWVLILQYFVVLPIVASRWTTPYDVVSNAISDLGAAACGEYEHRLVCSPLHVMANTSWVVTGLCIAGGAVLAWRMFPHDGGAQAGLTMLVVSGIGESLVGLNPEDASILHVPSAIVTIVVGLAGILTLSASLLRARQWMAVAAAGVVLGLVGVAALVVLVVDAFGSDHFGIVERFAAFPILIWLIICGLRIVLHRPDRRESLRA